MQQENRLFQDFARVLSALTGTLAGAGREAEARVKERLREVLVDLDFVPRDEFEAVAALARSTREELEALKAQLAAEATAPQADAPADPAG